jgi:hypothetical protein
VRRTIARTIASGTLPSDERGEYLVVTTSGFQVLVLAHAGMASKPDVTECSENDVDEGKDPCGHCQEDGWEACDYPGPYTHLMVFQPSERPEPWDKWKQFLRHKWLMSDPDIWRTSPFDYVPVAMVLDLVREHGGEVSDNTF